MNDQIRISLRTPSKVYVLTYLFSELLRLVVATPFATHVNKVLNSLESKENLL